MRRIWRMGKWIKASFLTNNRYDPVTGCWNWTGARLRGGYGQFRYMCRKQQVHRVSAHIYLGFDLRSKLFVCHHCDNPACFNPKHLFIGTHRDNMRDALNKGRLVSNLIALIEERKQRTHCHKGHPYSGENLWIDKKGHRRCRACLRQCRLPKHV